MKTNLKIWLQDQHFGVALFATKEFFFGVKQIKEVLMLNKPFYVGACILNLRKTHVRFSFMIKILNFTLITMKKSLEK